MKRRLKLSFSMIMVLLIFLSACSPKSSTESILYEGDTQMKATLKVMTITSERYFMEEFVDLFHAKYPNIEIKIINYTPNNYKETIEKEKPDIFVLSLEEYEQYIREDRLYDLDTLITNDEFNFEGIHPEIINYLRKLGNGKMYGLIPYFQSNVIYYNKDLFDKYNIPYPQDQMTWEELIQLAKRFPAQDGVSGLYIRDFHTLAHEIAWSRSLKEVNMKDMKVVLNSDSYKRVFELIMDAYESKAVVLPGINAFEVYDPFITGNSAMTVDYYYYINNKINWAKEEKGAQFHLNWDMVSSPVDESSRDISPYFLIGGTMSINAESEQKQAAWEFIKFVNGEEFAKAKSKTAGFFMLTRTDYIYNPEGKRMEAFYNLKPDVNRTVNYYDALPKGFLKQITGIINSEGKAAMVGAKTLDEAIASMQERGQQLLDQK
ncbi:multiple sugar transport system substrate-binding protein [Fontibacillus solani]|uniref:Multiple sugar transport system substrate-binding protein n=1 Tax=Fontibacillus solani TaxID=1572857 RepID=A0A7W3ST03_9BACL|nr:extracellular solute-binding protein [Fontibacillus solani]MBA9085707.1 multiple sugar transport system substrate-binding protein [Fontibacillus solani]